MTPQPRTARMLVVDDNECAAAALAALLTGAGYDVRTAHDGRTALALAESFQPDACVLDINMPGMDGYELARRLRELMQTPPVLATVTAEDGFDHLDRAAAVGFDLHFSKPADPAEVVEQLNACVRA